MTSKKGETFVSKLVTILNGDHKVNGDKIHHNGESLEVVPIYGTQGILRGINVKYPCNNVLNFQNSSFYSLNGEPFRFMDESRKEIYERLRTIFFFDSRKRDYSFDSLKRRIAS